jgi:hypothetical protein
MLRLLLQPGDNYEAGVFRRSLERGARSRAVPSGPELAASWPRQVGKMALPRASLGRSGAALSTVPNGRRHENPPTSALLCRNRDSAVLC